MRNSVRRVVFAIAVAATAAPLGAWIDSVEFPWNAYPKQLWERDLVWLKNIGVRHVSLPPGEQAGLMDVIAIVRRLDIEADLEGPVPDAMMPLMRAHGGPLTEPLDGTMEISALDVNAITDARDKLAAGSPAILWKHVHDTLGPEGYRAGALSFSGEETSATSPLRRNALLSSYWGKVFSTLKEAPGAGTRATPAPAGITVRQFIAEDGSSLVSVVNTGDQPWTGELKAAYPAVKKIIALPGVTVGAHDSLWLPVSVPLSDGPLCRDCSAFAAVDHLVYATAEMTAMEFENGVLAMEFSGSTGGEAILQLSRQPSGPFLAGGRPLPFDWDDKDQRVRLQIPPGAGREKRVRIGLAIEPPDSTAFFSSARVLMIGETNRLPAEFSSESIAERSRLHVGLPLKAEQEPADKTKAPLSLVYDVKVPEAAVHGDRADLALDADGKRMSHANPLLLRPVTVSMPDAISVQLADRSALSLFPATVPVDQRTGRNVTVKLTNNSPDIRNFHIELTAEGLEFSPEKMDVSLGGSLAREFSFRVFARDASAGVHGGNVKISGAASLAEPVQFAVIPADGEVAFQANGFSLLESAKTRAVFMPARWLELIDKENAKNLIGSGGKEFTSGPIAVQGDALTFGDRLVRLTDLKP